MFTPRDVIDAMQRAGSGYRTSTIRTHICSRMCANAPDHHAVVFEVRLRLPLPATALFPTTAIFHSSPWRAAQRSRSSRPNRREQGTNPDPPR